MLCKLVKAGKVYSVAFDEYGFVDTVSCGGILLSTKNPAVKQILNNADKIRRGGVPAGFERVR